MKKISLVILTVLFSGCSALGLVPPTRTPREQMIFDTTVAAWKDAGLYYPKQCDRSLRRTKLDTDMAKCPLGAKGCHDAMDGLVIHMHENWETRLLVHELFHSLHSCAFRLRGGDWMHASPYWRKKGEPADGPSVEAQAIQRAHSVVGP